jgi:hypothetical protein
LELQPLQVLEVLVLFGHKHLIVQQLDQVVVVAELMVIVLLQTQQVALGALTEVVAVQP